MPNDDIIDLSLNTWKKETTECVLFDYGVQSKDPGNQYVYVLHWFSRDCEFVNHLREDILLAPDSNALLAEVDRFTMLQYDANAQYRLLLKSLGYNENGVHYFIHDKHHAKVILREDHKVRVESRPYRAAKEMGREFHNTFKTAADLCSPLVKCNGGRVGNNEPMDDGSMDFLENGTVENKEEEKKEKQTQDVDEERRRKNPNRRRKNKTFWTKRRRKKTHRMPKKKTRKTKIGGRNSSYQAFVIYLGLSASLVFYNVPCTKKITRRNRFNWAAFSWPVTLGFFYKKGASRTDVWLRCSWGCVHVSIGPKHASISLWLGRSC